MPCPTCSHTLHKLGVIEGRPHLHCPRCGTHRIVCGCGPSGEPVHHDTVPMLVAWCRRFAAQYLPAGSGYAELWVKSGIAEAINVPTDRLTGEAR